MIVVVVVCGDGNWHYYIGMDEVHGAALALVIRLSRLLANKTKPMSCFRVMPSLSHSNCQVLFASTEAQELDFAHIMAGNDF